MKNTFVLIPIFLFTLIFSIAQAQNAAQDEAAIREFVNGFANAYSSLPKTRDKEAVMKYFSKDMTAEIFYFGITGKPKVSNSSYKGMEIYLDQILNSRDISILYQVKEFQGIRISGDLATVTYVVEYENRDTDGVWVKGEETVTQALRKFNNSWKSIHFTVVGFEDEKLKGTCRGEFFIEDGGDVVVRATIPSGQNYDTHYNAFEFTPSGNDQLIRLDGEIFKWVRANHEVLRLGKGDEENTKIGEALSKKDILLLLLKGVVYPEECSGFLVKTRTKK